MSYKLHYFDVRGRGELIRLIFKAAGQEFEDIRVTHEDWPKVKPTTPTGVLPFVETPDSHTLVQSSAISRFLSKKFGLYGKTDCETYLIERAFCQLHDIRAEIRAIRMLPEENKEEGMKKFAENKGITLLTTLTKFLQESGTGFFAGNSTSLADIFCVDIMDMFRDQFGANYKAIIDQFPALEEHYKRILDAVPAISEWIKKRPVTKY